MTTEKELLLALESFRAQRDSDYESLEIEGFRLCKLTMGRNKYWVAYRWNPKATKDRRREKIYIGKNPEKAREKIEAFLRG